MSDLPKAVEEFWGDRKAIHRTRILDRIDEYRASNMLLTHPDSPVRIALEAAPEILEMAKVLAEKNCECSPGFLCGFHRNIKRFEQALAALEVE